MRNLLPRTASVVLVGVLGLAPLLHPAVAHGGPVEDKRAEATRVANQLESQAARVVSLSRELERTRRWGEQTDAAVAQAEADLNVTKAKVDASRTRLEHHAVDAYVRGGGAAMFSQFWSTNSDATVRHEYLKLAAGSDRTTIDQLRAAREDLQARRAHLASLRDDARAAAAKLIAAKASLEQAIATQKSALARLNRELAQLVAEEQRKRLAALAAKARAAHEGGLGGTFACIRQLESSNNYSAPGGGAYQFQDATWQGMGHSGTASDAPPAEQDAAAVELQKRSGWSPWTTAAACGAV